MLALAAIAVLALAISYLPRAGAQRGGHAFFYQPWPSVPPDNGTVVMFTTAPRSTGGTGVVVRPHAALDGHKVAAVHITWLRHNKASAANGLRVYALDDTGIWRETDLGDDSRPPVSQIGTAAPLQIPALSAGVSRRVTLVVSHLRHVAIEYTAGADNPEEWNGVISVELDNGVVIQ